MHTGSVATIFSSQNMTFLLPVAALQREKQAFQKQFYAPNSITTRGVQVRRYLEFIEEFRGHFPTTPCPPAQAALYAVWLARTLKYTSVLNYLSGLNFFLRSEGSEPIDYKNFEMASTLKGIRRELGCHPKQATPLLPNMLRQIFAGLTPSEGHTAWRAAVLCSFRALLRKCQVTASESALRRSDFSFRPWGMLVRVRRSKTIQFSERMLEIPVARCPDESPCAVYWAERHFREVPAGPDAMAFRVTTHGGISTDMQYSVYQGMLKYFCERAGLNPGDYSSHSLRRGGCTFLSLCGATLEELRVRGDWASDTIFTYLQTPLSVRIINDIRVSNTLAITPETVY